MHIPRFGMGCSALGNLYRAVSDAEAHATLMHALEAGIRYFDVAPLYGFGLAEQRLGAALAAVTAAPDFVISTKVGRILRPTHAPGPREGFVDPLPFETTFDYTFEGVLSSHEASLERLRLSKVHLLLAHDLGERTHGSASMRMTADFLDGGYAAMRSLRARGQIDAIGIGVNETAICEMLLDRVELDVILLAGRYTLLEQGGLELLNRCQRLGVRVIIGGPFNSGLLVESGDSPVVHYDYGIAPPEVLDVVRGLRSVCAEFGVSLPAAALQFAAAHPAVSCVLPGLASERQIDQTLTWANEAIPIELWNALRSAGLIAPGAPIPAR